MGTAGIQVNSNNTDSNNAITWDDGVNWHIDRDGYLIFNVTNPYLYDLYNISFDIKLGGGGRFFRGNPETDAFVDHHPSGETIEVKSNDPVIDPRPIIRRPLFFGTYYLTIDITIDGTYYGQHWLLFYGLFIYLIIIDSGFTPGN